MITFRNFPKNYQLIFDAISDPVFLIAKSGEIHDFKGKHPHTFFVRSGELIGTKITELLPETASKSIMNAIERAFQTQEVHRLTYVLPKNGAESTYEIRVIAILKANMAVMIIRKIPALQEMANEARDSEPRFNTLMESAPVGMLLYHEDRFVMLNQRAVAMLGAKEKAEIQGRGLSDFLLPEQQPAVQTRIKRMLHEALGDQSNLQLTLRGVDGKLRNIELIGNPTTFKGSPALQMTLIEIAHPPRRDVEKSGRIMELEAIESLVLALEGDIDFKSMLSTVLDKTLNALNLSDGAISLFLNTTNKPSHQVTAGWMRKLSRIPIKLDQTLTGEVLQSDNTRIIDSLEHSNPEFAEIMPEGWGLIGAPIQASGKTIGVMWASFEPSRQLQTDEMKTFDVMTRLAGTIISRMHLYQQTLWELDQTQAQYAIDRAVASLYDIDPMQEVICEQGCKFLPADAVSLLLYQSHTMSLVYGDSSGFYQTLPSNLEVQMGEGPAGQAALDKNTVYIENLESAVSKCHRYETFIKEGFLSYLAVPLVVKGELKGVLEIFHRQPFDYDAGFEQRVESLAHQAGIAIDNLQLYDQLKRNNQELLLTYETSIEDLAEAQDMSDQDTEGHTLRVTLLTLKLARKMGVDEDELVHIRRGAMLHDMGRINIPDSILGKEGPLTDEEWEVMQKHPDNAFKMLSPIAYLRRAIDIPYCHHEKWDGTGYPRGLKGTEIPLAARIFAVADVYDALTSDRPYRDAWPHKKALEHIQQGAGSHFDPQVVEAFMKVVSS